MKQKSTTPLFQFGTTLVVVLLLCVGNAGAQQSKEDAAWALYTQNKFVESADAYEALLKTNKPSARFYYQAASANFRANRRGRSRQLCTYIVSNFGNSAEAAACKKLFPELVDHAELTSTKNLPPGFYDSLPADVRGQLNTPAGKEKFKAALIDYNKRIMAERRAAKSQGETIASTTLSVGSRGGRFAVDANLKRGDHPFTAEQIGKDGANGIDQSVNPNCWFEASMAALAELPRGRRLLASMITYGGNKTYVVRFPGDGEEYKISEETLDSHGVHDRALWASLLECAQVMKFPNNRGAEGAFGDESRLAVGLGCITGCKAQLLNPRSADPQEISSFIFGAVSSKNPIVCGTLPDSYLGSLPPLVVGSHAYTIIGFDPASNMITIRNPHGRHSDQFSLDDDPNHRLFEQKENGVFKMHVTLFQKYFYTACRSFI